ncbi:Uncharacterised protein [Bordetella pertussis]|nr:Uncharacterised protein [Bordetella pertussis]CFL81375.1 Uncharacterised protein [Bordetella pertussis]CFM28435.1 Uncharacterised protein [Bordetella pertussis]CFM88501.1 Uncharacterised protein [Bordetella pertussis]CFN93856.1 Uncharacterised protein [Bordetella pertussis]
MAGIPGGRAGQRAENPGPGIALAPSTPRRADLRAGRIMHGPEGQRAGQLGPLERIVAPLGIEPDDCPSQPYAADPHRHVRLQPDLPAVGIDVAVGVDRSLMGQQAGAWRHLHPIGAVALGQHAFLERRDAAIAPGTEVHGAGRVAAPPLYGLPTRTGHAHGERIGLGQLVGYPARGPARCSALCAAPAVHARIPGAETRRGCTCPANAPPRG